MKGTNDYLYCNVSCARSNLLEDEIPKTPFKDGIKKDGHSHRSVYHLDVYETNDGRLFMDDGEYEPCQINFCYICGYKAVKKIKK